jgi:hypothetical protein
MDSLTVIIAILTAILFTWVGYFLGNFFPFLGIKQKGVRDDRLSVDKATTRKFFQKITNYFSDGEIDDVGQDVEGQPVTIDDHQSEKLISKTRLKDLNQVWYDKSERKLFAEYKGVIIDLDERLSPEQHSLMSFLLLDLQDKVGISARLRSVIAEREEEAFPEEDEEESVHPSFHPIKAFVQYIQADAPKLEDEPDSVPFQINEILQNKLKGTQLQSLGISISEWPNKGVVFIVGVDVYDEIHQIPDSRIRQVINEAVKEWERQERKN